MSYRNMADNVSFSDEEGCCGTRTKLEKKLATALTIVIVIETLLLAFVLILIFGFGAFDKNKTTTVYVNTTCGANKTTEDVCEAKVCLERSLFIMNAIDTTADPCDDFYQYACGTWIKNTQIPPDKSKVGTFNDIQDNVNNMINSSLTNRKVTPGSTNAVDKAAFTHQRCVSYDSITPVNVSLDMLKKRVVDAVGGGPLFTSSWNPDTANATLTIAGVEVLSRDNFLSISVMADRKNSSRNRITLQQPNFFLQRSQLLDVTSDAFQAYRNYTISTIRELTNVYAPDVLKNETEFIRYIDDALALERDIANVSFDPDQIDDETKTYSLIKFGSLDPVLQSLLSAVVNATVSMGIDKDEDIQLLVGPGFLDKFVPVIKTASKQAIADFGIWALIRGQFSGSLPAYIRKFYSDFSLVVFGSLPKSRWEDCLDLTSSYYTYSVGRIYIDEHFDKSIKAKVTQEVQLIANKFLNDSLINNDWLDAGTKAAAIEKMHALGLQVAYPDFILDDTRLNGMYAKYPNVADIDLVTIVSGCEDAKSIATVQSWVDRVVDKTLWDMGPQEVNAFYDPNINTIAIPAGILYPPFYHEQLPNSMNYGGIGWVIGHEISHGYDNNGRHYDKDGNMNDWWQSNATVDAFNQRAKCIIDEYSQFCYPDLPTPPRCVNGNYTQGENIADNGGLPTSLHSYEQWKATGNYDTQLPGLSYLTDEQLFYITAANVWCMKQTQQSLQIQLMSDPHSPGQYRVNGVFRNVPEFATTWKCKAGSKMNPPQAQRCKVW